MYPWWKLFVCLCILICMLLKVLWLHRQTCNNCDVNCFFLLLSIHHWPGNRMSARGGKKKATKLSRSARAGVIFPVGRMMRYLRTGTHKYRIGMGAPVYMAAVIEYLAGRCFLLSLANNLFQPTLQYHVFTVRVLKENASWSQLKSWSWQEMQHGTTRKAE